MQGTPSRLFHSAVGVDGLSFIFNCLNGVLDRDMDINAESYIDIKRESIMGFNQNG